MPLPPNLGENLKEQRGNLRPRIITLDIETTPNLCWTWGIHNQEIPINHIIDPQHILCFAVKDLNSPVTHFYNGSDMLSRLHRWLDDADAVITYNGRKYDIPHINREFQQESFSPPSPYKQIDLYPIVRAAFDFPSYKLAYVAPALGIGEKTDSGGLENTIACYRDNNREAWEKMRGYNTNDVIITEKLYHEVKPWIRTHPNLAAYLRDIVCPVCGSHNLQSRGTQVTVTCAYQRYQCMDCGHWSRAVKRSEHVGIRSVSE